MTRTLRNLLLGLLLLLLVILGAIWGLTPMIAKRVLANYFQSQGAQLQVADISLHPLSSELQAKDVRISRQGKDALLLTKLSLQIRLPALLDHRIEIPAVHIEGLQLQVQQDGSAWQVAGLVLGGEAATPSTQDNSDSSPWTLQLGSLVVDHSKLQLAQNGRQDALGIQHWQTQDIQVQWPDFRANFNFEGTINAAALGFSGQILGPLSSLQLLLDSHLDKFPLQDVDSYLPPALKQSTGLLGVSSHLRLEMHDQQLRLNLEDSKARLEDAHMRYAPYLLNTNNLALNLQQLDLEMRSGKLVQLSLTQQLASDGVALFQNDEQHLLVSWNGQTSKDMSLQLQAADSANDTPATLALNIPQLQLQQLSLSRLRQDNDNLPALLNVANLTLNGMAIGPNSTDIESIALQNVDSHLILSAKHKPLNLIQLSSATENATPTSTGSASTDSAAAATAPGYGFSLGRFEITGDNHIDVVDQSITPAFTRNFALESFHIDHLDNRQPDQPSAFELKGSTDRYSKYQAEGTIKPFTKLLNLDTTATLKEVSLPPLSAYMADALGYQWQSGQLDLDLTTRIVDGKIDGKSHILLRGASLEAATNQKSMTKSATSIPLNVAFGMLKDSDGNVDLDIPLKGDVNNPDFGMSGFVSLLLKKAIFEGATSYLAQAFVPYVGVVSVVQMAGQEMLKIRIESLTLPAAQLPGTAQQDFVDKFHKLMQDKQNLQVKVCGVATPADLDLPADATLNATQTEQLNNLASNRAATFKQLVIDLGGVASLRILECNGGIDTSASAKPRLDFST